MPDEERTYINGRWYRVICTVTLGPPLRPAEPICKPEIEELHRQYPGLVDETRASTGAALGGKKSVKSAARENNATRRCISRYWEPWQRELLARWKRK